jgi:hypothetical protein
MFIWQDLVSFWKSLVCVCVCYWASSLHLSHAFCHFCSVYFGARVLLFAQADLDVILLFYAFWSHWDYRWAAPHLDFFHWDGSCKHFLPDLAGNCDPSYLNFPSILGSQVWARDAWLLLLVVMTKVFLACVVYLLLQS